MRYAMLLTLLLALTACSTPDTRRDGAQERPATVDPQPATVALPPGEARLPVPGGAVWYRRSGTGPGLPVVLLHGGPGFNSFYLKPLEALGDDRPVIRYDQLGAGKSGMTTDTTLFTIAHFVAELDSLRSHLGLEQMHLVGHSWGSILAVEYYRAHPTHVASMVLASAALDIPAWERNARRLLKQLPDSMQRAIALREQQGQFDAPDYQAALGEFYARWVWRHPVAADLDSTMATANMAIYHYMQGPSEFTITGTLKAYSATGFLGTIAVPVLYTVGEFDEANPEIIRKHASLTPGAKVTVIPGAAHITMWDNPAATERAVRAFLREADAATPRGR